MKKLFVATALMSLATTVLAANSPVSVPENMSVAKTAAAPSVNGDTQVFVNKTSRKLLLSIGDFFPTDYVIYPGDTEWVYVSTNNQTVQIRDYN